MKHLKTFESFSYSADVENLDEGVMDMFKKAKKAFTDLGKPPLNKTRKKIITKAVSGLDTEKITCMALGKDGEKLPFDKDQFLKLAEETDNFNGSSLVKGDCIHYVSGNFSSSSRGLSKGMGG
jgi:endonuclease/exonuclease/phosphatase (EEP) superfamily protein YafD